MIKKLLSNKLTSTASSQFVVFGLKMLDTHTPFMKISGTFLCIASLSVLFFGWHHATKEEAPVVVTVSTKSSKSNRKRARASRSAI